MLISAINYVEIYIPWCLLKHFISCIGGLCICSPEECCLSCLYSGSGYDDPHTSFSEELSILTGLTRWRICKSVHNIFVFLLRVPFMLHARLLDVIHLVCSKKLVIIFWHRLFELNLSQGQPWFSFALSHLQPEMAKLFEEKVHLGSKNYEICKAYIMISI